MKTKINTIFRSIQAFGELCRGSQDIQDFGYNYLDDFSKRVENQGIKEAVKGNKAVRLSFTKAVSGDLDQPSSVAVSKRSKIPKVLTPLRESLDTMEGRRQVLTVLSFTRAFEPKEMDDSGLSKITAPEDCSPGVVAIIIAHLPSFLRTLNATEPKSISGDGKGIATSKSGPDGHAIASMYQSLKAITPQDFSDLEILGGSQFGAVLKRNKSLGPHLSWYNNFVKVFQLKDGKGSGGRLQMIPDSELKTRFIGIGNYGLQNSLKALHDYEFTLLRRLRSDCTYDQSKAPRVLEQYPGNHFWSIDLSNATERFPRSVQRALIQNLVSPDYAESGERVISKPLLFKGKEVSFEAGQPMGYYSSWATFSLCHHGVVHTACRVNNVHPKGKYVILGDDIVISHDKVAATYRMMIEALGVELNMGKTHVSANHYEFAKRGYAHGEGEGSPFPIKAVINAKHSSDMLHALLTGQLKGGFLTEDIVEYCSILISGLHENYSDGFKTHCKKIASILKITLEASVKAITWDEAFRALAKVFELEISFPSDIDRVTEFIFSSDILRGGLKKSFAAKWLVDSGALGDCIPRETLNDTLDQESWVYDLPHPSISREVIRYFIEDIRFTDYSETLKSVMTKNQRSVLIKDLSTLFTDRQQSLDGASCLKFGKYLVSTLKQVARTDESQHSDMSTGVRIILQKHLDDGGVVGLISLNFPQFKDIMLEEMKKYYETTQNEPLEQEDFDGLLESGFGYDENKRTIKGIQFKKGVPPINYMYHIKALAQRRDQNAG